MSGLASLEPISAQVDRSSATSQSTTARNEASLDSSDIADIGILGRRVIEADGRFIPPTLFSRSKNSRLLFLAFERSLQLVLKPDFDQPVGQIAIG